MADVEKIMNTPDDVDVIVETEKDEHSAEKSPDFGIESPIRLDIFTASPSLSASKKLRKRSSLNAKHSSLDAESSDKSQEKSAKTRREDGGKLQA